MGITLVVLLLKYGMKKDIQLSTLILRKRKIHVLVHTITIPGKGGEVQLTDGIRLLLKEGCKGYSVNLTEKEKRFDIENIPSYYEAFIDFALNDEKHGYQFKQYIIKKFNI